VETGIIHNPHHYEYLRQQNGGVIPRNPGDVACGGGITVHDIQLAFAKLHGRPPAPAPAIRRGINVVGINPPSDESRVYAVHRVYMHIQEVELPAYAVNTNLDNEDLRIKYLVGEIDEGRFKVLLQQREKKNEKKQEVHMVLFTYNAVVMDLLNTLRTMTTAEQVTQLLANIDNIRAYTNTCMQPISKRYACVVPQITDTKMESKKF
jgi:hypothetical protein